MTPFELVGQYHERSKHHLQRYAPGPDGLDWDSQPDPFRTYDGAHQIELPLLGAELPGRWDQLFVPAGLPAQALNRVNIARLFELSLGLSAWKSYGGSRWALRCNPSSGNLHPTEGYLICPDLPDLPAGVFHYRSDLHVLEQRASAPLAWPDGVLVALSGIHWREAWKYGLRAFRYCQHDAGHALAALAYAAALLGWPARRLNWGDDQLAILCGLARTPDFPPGDGEDPEALLWIGPGPPPAAAAVLAALAAGEWAGRANVLSRSHRDWPEIPTVAEASRRPDEEPAAAPAPNLPALPALAPASDLAASLLIRRRRSAQAFDGVTSMTARHFFRLLDALLPRPKLPPWSLLAAAPAVHPVLFVHRVDQLEPGIYCLPRCPEALPELRAALHPQWFWEPVDAAPPQLPLYLLARYDARGFAASASCHQEIASDSAFMLSMLARFDDLEAAPWRYRERFAEAGMLGQALYLEAEAGDLQGTGIGCYFDDVVHRALGVDTTRFQDLYHFTVGRALLDTRLGSAAAYADLVRPRQA